VPTFSVLIAAYQAAEFVGEAVSSALAQTLPPHEVIVCDDGSTDDIEGALDPYMDRIVLLRRDHHGEAATKNAAARAASGEFVAFLDADDMYMPERIEAMSELAALRPDLDILTTDSFMELDGQVVRRYYDESFTFEVDDQRTAILEWCFISGATAIRRERLLGVGGFDESVYTNDWDCWIRLVFSGSRAGLVDEPLVRYRLHEGAQSSSPARMARGQAETLAAAARMIELTHYERTVLARSLSMRQRAAELEEARLALLEGAPDGRRRSLAVAARSENNINTRIKAMAGVIAPGLTRRFLLSRARRRWIAAGGVEVLRKS
jgi:glycosyltransferase involved in cell wall biosynthesis